MVGSVYFASIVAIGHFWHWQENGIKTVGHGLDLFVLQHMKATALDNGRYSLGCFYCNAPLQWVESGQGDGLSGISFCPRCFPLEYRKQTKEFEL